MSLSRVFLSCLLCYLAGCANIPDSYAPPIQRKPLEPAGFGDFGQFVEMGDPRADASIVKDVSQTIESGAWRWTQKRPELDFYLDATDGWKLVVDFAVAGATFEQTGPVTISFSVNGNLLDKVRCAAPGQQHFEKPVPPAYLRAKAANRVTMEIDKVWVAKQDGVILGFILSRAGFKR